MMTQEEYRHWRSYFNAPHLRSIADYGIHKTDVDHAKELGCATYHGFLHVLYQKLLQHYPVEYVIKNELIAWILSQSHEGYLATEQYSNGSYADVIRITKDQSTVYEIKTKYDSDKRLRKQMKDYSQVFDHVILVTNEGHSFKFMKSVPDYVGVLTMNGAGQISFLRLPQNHDDTINKFCLHRALHAKERRDLKHDFFATCTPEQESYRHMYNEKFIEDFISTVEMSKIVKQHWSQRASIRHLRFLPKIPYCLHTALYEYRIQVKEWQTILALLHEPFETLNRNKHGSYILRT